MPVGILRTERADILAIHGARGLFPQSLRANSSGRTRTHLEERWCEKTGIGENSRQLQVRLQHQLQLCIQRTLHLLVVRPLCASASVATVSSDTERDLQEDPNL
jgi:hypothetical protein